MGVTRLSRVKIQPLQDVSASQKKMEYLFCYAIPVFSLSIKSAGGFITGLTAEQTGLSPIYILDNIIPTTHYLRAQGGNLVAKH